MGCAILQAKDVRDVALLEKKKEVFVNLMESTLILHKTTADAGNFIIAVKSLQEGLN